LRPEAEGDAQGARDRSLRPGFARGLAWIRPSLRSHCTATPAELPAAGEVAVTQERRSLMPRSRTHPEIEVRPHRVEAPYGIEVAGGGWGSCPVRITIGGEATTRLRVLLGEPQAELVRPVGGEFVVVADAPGLKAGEHAVHVEAVGHAAKESAEAALE